MSKRREIERLSLSHNPILGFLQKWGCFRGRRKSGGGNYPSAHVTIDLFVWSYYSHNSIFFSFVSQVIQYVCKQVETCFVQIWFKNLSSFKNTSKLDMFISQADSKQTLIKWIMSWDICLHLICLDNELIPNELINMRNGA